MEARISATSNVKVIQNAFADFATGNINGIVSACTDDVIWGSVPSPTVPYAGTFYGKEGVMEFFTALGSNVNYTNFEPQEFFTQGDTVVVLGHHAGTIKSTGKTIDHDWCMKFNMQDGKVKKYFVFLDSLEQANAFKE